MSPAEAHRCRGCRSTRGEVVLDLGDQPAADHFPLVSDPGPDPRHPLAMWWCADCGLAQLRDDTTVPDEPRAIEPRAAVRQAYEAVDELLDAGLLTPGEFIEFPSPHGGSWSEALLAGGFRPARGPRAGVVVDVYGLMHDARPGGRAAGSSRGTDRGRNARAAVPELCGDAATSRVERPAPRALRLSQRPRSTPTPCGSRAVRLRGAQL